MNQSQIIRSTMRASPHVLFLTLSSYAFYLVVATPFRIVGLLGPAASISFYIAGLRLKDFDEIAVGWLILGSISVLYFLAQGISQPAFLVILVLLLLMGFDLSRFAQKLESVQFGKLVPLSSEMELLKGYFRRFGLVFLITLFVSLASSEVSSSVPRIVLLSSWEIIAMSSICLCVSLVLASMFAKNSPEERRF